jgi:hypothetical protein
MPSPIELVDLTKFYEVPYTSPSRTIYDKKNF